MANEYRITQFKVHGVLAASGIKARVTQITVNALRAYAEARVSQAAVHVLRSISGSAYAPDARVSQVAIHVLRTIDATGGFVPRIKFL